MSIDQTPRQRDDLPLSEQGFLGALLLRPGLTGETAGQVQPEDLQSPLLADLYRSMIGLWARGVEPTPETIADDCASRRKVPGSSVRAEIVTLMARTGAAAPSYYVPAILESALRRKLASTCRQVLDIAADPEVPGYDALETARELLANLDVPVDAPSEMVPAPAFCEGEDSWDWLIPNLIERGDRILIVAAEGEGKSMLARQLAMTAAVGVYPFVGPSTPWGLRNYNPLRVTLIDLENSPMLVRRRLRPLLAQARSMRPSADPSNLGVICKPGGVDVTRRTDARWLSSQLMTARPDLVVIGPLYKLFAADDKWEQGARAVTTLLDDLRARLNFGLIMETHAPQGFGAQRHLRPIGSSLWLRWPELVVTFARYDDDKNTHVVRVRLTKDRDERDWPKFLKRGGDWPWTPCGDPEGPTGQPAPPSERPLYEQGDQIF